jgi:septum formation protein
MMPSSALILASASTSRQRMLTAAGVPFTVQPARIDEEDLKASLKAEGVSPRALADALAEAKAVSISRRFPESLVLGADSILIDAAGVVHDKASSRADARARLLTLRASEHRLMSAAVIAQGGAPVWRIVDTAKLTMRAFSDAFIDAYLDQLGETALSSVGSYHLEGLGAQLFSRVSGDHFTVLGLPLLPVLDFLRTRGILPS